MTKKKNEEKNPQGTPVDQPESSENMQNESGSEQTQTNQADLGSLQDELEKTKAQSKDFFEGWQRERADFVNYKKRIDREQASLKNYISGEIVKKYLLVLDDMELAIKNQPTCIECQGWTDGIQLIHQKLNAILESEGVEKIPVEGGFDPNIHEAITQIDSPTHESGQIVDVMRQGYKIGDRILRPALVVVAR
jgi:molecular chaperone GrpE